MIEQNQELGDGLFLGYKIVIMTKSKTFLRSFCVKAEHSTYATAPSSLANVIPSTWDFDIAINDFIWTDLVQLSFLVESWPSLKSILVPTKMNGLLGELCFISGYHFVFTFSKVTGLVTS